MDSRVDTFTRSFIMLVLTTWFSGCGGCKKYSANDYFHDPDVIALANAAAEGDTAEIDRLLARGVDVNTMGKEGMTPLAFALVNNNEKGFLYLLQHGADPNLQDEEGDSVLSLVARRENDSKWLEMVLEHGGDPNLVDPIDTIDSYKDATPIFNAIRSKNILNVQLLVDAGADLDHQNALGHTPAMYAARFRWYRVVYLFLERGAEWSIKNKFGDDIAYYCHSYGPRNKKFREDYEYYFKVLDFLRDKGVDLKAAKQAADKHMGRK